MKYDKKRSFSFSEGRTYAQALHHLIKHSSDNQPRFDLGDSKSMPCPLTLKETMQARVEDPELFDRYLDTATGIAYKAESDLVKFIPESLELITLSEGFNKAYVDIKYKLVDGEEIDASLASHKDLWLVAMGGHDSENSALYNEYRATLANKKGFDAGDDRLMHFYRLSKPSKDQLRVVVALGGLSFADGSSDYLNDGTRLLRVD